MFISKEDQIFHEYLTMSIKVASEKKETSLWKGLSENSSRALRTLRQQPGSQGGQRQHWRPSIWLLHQIMSMKC